MKITRIIAIITGLLTAVVYTIYIIIKYQGIAIIYNIIRASLVAILLGIIAYFIVLGIGKLIHELTKPRKEGVK